MNKNTENTANSVELAGNLESILAKLEKCCSELREAADSLKDGADFDKAEFLADEAIWLLYYEIEESLKAMGWKPLEFRMDSSITVAGVAVIMKEHADRDCPICPDMSRALAKRLDGARIGLEA